MTPKPAILNLNAFTRVRRPLRRQTQPLKENYQEASGNTYLYIIVAVVLFVILLAGYIYKKGGVNN
jgi:hypothetical protein